MTSPSARCLTGSSLAEALRESRAATLSCVADLDDADWLMPARLGVNPTAWELGHLAWFAEFWVLRGPHALQPDGFVAAAKPPSILGPDTLFDSAQLRHADRWTAPLPSRDALIELLENQLAECLDTMPGEQASDDAHYFHRLALFHEDMHREAFTWTRAALGRPAPAGLAEMPGFRVDAPIAVGAGVFEIGRDAADAGFSFDNEQPRTAVRLDAFEIDTSAVTNRQFQGFVVSGGYDDPGLWSGPGAWWRARRTISHPERWRLAVGGGWEARWFDRWLALDPLAPVAHVNAYEAEAYCRWAGRRLPSAAEWETAAGHASFQWGHSVWEWTADAFDPYPGFHAGPYRDYSQPWFGSHRELRGGSVATHSRLHDRRYRNFFNPDRNDLFSGFRTARSS